MLLAGDFDRAVLAVALAEIAAVPVDMVDVADVGSTGRNWDAAVSCVYEPTTGHVSWMLDIHLTDAVQSPPTEAATAAHLAERLAAPVLYPAESSPPSAYWLAAPGGLVARARVYTLDDGDRPEFTIDAVDVPVPSLPAVPVVAQPEVIREHRVSTPVADALDAWLAAIPPDQVAGHGVWFARTRLGAWESLTARMASGWPPDGWYPAEYYREDLETRDQLATAVEALLPGLADPFGAALARVDDAFRASTREVGDPDQVAEALGAGKIGSGSRGWWWRRVPEPEPWRHGRSRPR
ncbi:MAG TPA: hypothetical protein VF054_01895 [Micromonosporaceae bacterium]